MTGLSLMTSKWQIYYFSNLVENLNLQVPGILVNCSCQIENPIFKAILEYQNHYNIAPIK